MRSPLMKAALAMLATACLSSFAALPPKYLAVEDFQKCLASEPQGTATVWCTPARKPAACPQASWKQLGTLKGQDKVPACGRQQQPA